MIAAEVSDERSGYMTRGHNNSRMITMGSEIVGDTLAKMSLKVLLKVNTMVVDTKPRRYA